MPKAIKRVKTALPHKLIPLPNADKGFHESVDKLHQSKANFPHPFRAALVGAPNSGKSTLAANLILHQDPPFQRVIVWHCDPETKEWEHTTDDIVSECPQMEDFDPDVKTCCVIDDVALKSLGRDERMRLDRLCGNWSTHRNISVILTSQQPNQLPANIRRMMNVFCLWRSTDAQSLKDVALKCGIQGGELGELLRLLDGPKDSLCIDLTGSPYRYRRNVFDVIEEA